jgi:hypothetical protein
MVEPGKVAQLRAADRQIRNHLLNGRTSAETLAGQSKLIRIPDRFRLSDPDDLASARGPAPAGALLLRGFRVESKVGRRPQRHYRRLM